jgi:hypothetical protein
MEITHKQSLFNVAPNDSFTSMVTNFRDQRFHKEYPRCCYLGITIIFFLGGGTHFMLFCPTLWFPGMKTVKQGLLSMYTYIDITAHEISKRKVTHAYSIIQINSTNL